MSTQQGYSAQQAAGLSGLQVRNIWVQAVNLRTGLWIALLSLFVMLAPTVVHAQSFFFEVAEPYQGITERLSHDDIDSAQEFLQSLPAELTGTSDYYFLQGLLKMLELPDAGMFRAVRLSRGLKRDLEQALEVDPDHELSHFGLIQFHRFAPGLIGGSEEQLEHHKARLVELDSPLQFPAELPRARMEEDEAAEIAIYEAWMAHSPDSFDAHFEYATRLIGLQRYTQAEQQLANTLLLAEPDQLGDIHYQQLRLAAEADDSISQAYREEAYTAASKLLNNEPEHFNAPPAGWLQLRMAQVALKLNEHEAAADHLQYANQLAANDDDELQAKLEELRQQLTQPA